jgi:hypothetical protein
MRTGANVSDGPGLFYLAGWGAACIGALALFLAHRGRFTIASAAYWRFLLVPWKLVTSVLAAAGITLIAPYTSDPTWDYVDAAFMSVLAFATAPWVLGTLYGAVRGRATPEQIYVAVCVWLFSVSWSYDLYLLCRDGFYPVTWWANLVASSVLYLAAGLFWSLEWSPSTGGMFAFTLEGWPHASVTTTVAFRRILWPALSFMLVVGIMILSFATGGR